jgi:PAS domain S-box-containing protein
VASGFVITATLLYLLFVFAPQERESAVRHWRARLEVIAADRRANLEKTIQHYLGDAATFADYPTAKYLATGALPPDEVAPKDSAESHLRSLFQSAARTHRLDNVWLVNANGVYVTRARQADPPSDSIAKALALEIVGSSELGFRHSTRPSARDQTYFGAPVRSPDARRVVGAVIVAVDSRSEIFSIVTAEWGGTTTGETLLVERQGDSVAVIAGLTKARAKNITYPIWSSRRAGAHALLGHESFRECVDYDNERVFAVGRQVRKAPWAIVLKVDRAEVLGQSTLKIIQVAAAVLGLLSAMAGAGYAIITRLRARYTLELSREAERNARADEELRRSHALLQSITEGTNEAIFVKDTDEKYLFINSAGARGMGLTPGQIVGKTSADVLLPADARAFSDFDRTVLDTGAPVAIEHTVDRDGKRQTSLISGSPIFDEIGNVTGVIGIVRDMTELKEAQQRLRFLFENAAVGIATATAAGTIMEVNPHFAGMLGYQPHELRGKSLMDITPPVDRQLQERWMPRYAAPGRDFIVRQKRYLRKDGTNVWARLAITVVRKSDRTPDYYLGIIEDITTQYETEQALKETQQRFDAVSARAGALLAANVVGIAIGTAEGAILEANDYYLDLIGYSREELLEGTIRWPDITPSEHLTADYKAIAEIRERGTSTPYEKEYVRKDGRRVWVLIGDTLLSSPKEEILSFVVDITAKKSLELQYLHAQKMEAVGRLAGGVAHDFNNILTAIKGIACLAVDEISESDPHRADLIEISDCADRATALTRQLLAVSRRQVLQPRVFDMRDLLQNMTRMLKRLIGEDVDLRFETMSEPLTVHADPAQIEQVVLNLVINARDAMPHGGQLRISTVLTDAGALQPHVALSVSDNGTGMNQETISRVFEPFFTTKEQGKGTGLGLATVYGIVEQSSGTVSVTSAVGQGTTFTVCLPYARITETKAADIPMAAAVAMKKKALVLVVEDDDAVRSLVRRAIQREGHQVLEARNAGEALLLAERYHEELDLVVTDVIMPGMSGHDLVRRLRENYGSLNVLFMSGYTAEIFAQNGKPDGAFIEKPFAPRDLWARIAEILSTNSHQGQATH